jgi:hypothetical protein
MKDNSKYTITIKVKVDQHGTSTQTSFRSNHTNMSETTKIYNQHVRK